MQFGAGVASFQFCCVGLLHQMQDALRRERLKVTAGWMRQPHTGSIDTSNVTALPCAAFTPPPAPATSCGRLKVTVVQV